MSLLGLAVMVSGALLLALLPTSFGAAGYVAAIAVLTAGYGLFQNANNTAVIPAQLEAMRGGARIGITLDRPLADGTWHALARNARRLRQGDTLRFAGTDALTASDTGPENSASGSWMPCSV